MREDEACLEIGELVYDGWSDDEIAEMARKMASEYRAEFNAALANRSASPPPGDTE
jgi:hypothetical protein